MNIVREYINEKFAVDSDPIRDMNIGMPYMTDIRNLLEKLKNKYGGEISFRNYKKGDDPRFVGRWVKPTSRFYWAGYDSHIDVFEVHYYKNDKLPKKFWVGWESPIKYFVAGAECIDINECEETIESMINR